MTFAMATMRAHRSATRSTIKYSSTDLDAESSDNAVEEITQTFDSMDIEEG